LESFKIDIKGLVQGVGFRPFVYKMARKHRLTGWVKNTLKGVEIHVEGALEFIDNFYNEIQYPPVIADIISLHKTQVAPGNYQAFEILESSGASEEITRISPDLAVCDDCLADMKIQPHRIGYPLVNCTNCGPRFSIIKDMPYDRQATTMDKFAMCDVCRKEYHDIHNRRFHAQPVACNHCGPSYAMYAGEVTISDMDEIIKCTALYVNDGNVLALKGIGGFQIICDAFNEKAVQRVRAIKHRDVKPFAVMFKDIETVARYNSISDQEITSLTSWKRPIVLIRAKQQPAPSVNAGFHTTGAILPYMPLHYMLFEKLGTPAIVFTSANLSDEPVIIDNDEVKEKLGQDVDAIVAYNRDVYNRTDDSVCQVVNNKERIIRRSRGYVPIPFQLKRNTEGILATGAELVNSFCIGKGSEAILSQYVGDLKNFSTYRSFTETIEKFKAFFRFKPSLVVHDMHPDYFSANYAIGLGIPTLAVQHHHAHIASVMAEYNLDEEVIGVCFDGTGYGTDGNLWGSEFFIADATGFERMLHFEYIPLPGGEQAIREPWRIAVSYLYKYYGNAFRVFDLPFLENIGPYKIDIIVSMIDKRLNTPLACGAGRLFDAIAALLGICPFAGFEAEAPMRLENMVLPGYNDYYPFAIENTISFKSMFQGIINDIRTGLSLSRIATRFHNTMVEVIVRATCEISRASGVSKVVLSGGTFQNRYILEKAENLLHEKKFSVYTPCRVPANDGGIALGQLMIGAKKQDVST
jgi:hydrogenase maturation protein HypF